MKKENLIFVIFLIFGDYIMVQDLVLEKLIPDQSIIDRLKTTKISDFSQDQYSSLLSELFLTKDNLEFLEDLTTIIQFQQRPRGLQLAQVSQSAGVSSSSYVTLLEIPKNRTYDIQSVVMISTSTADSVINYALELDGMEYLLKTVEYTHPSFGQNVDFSTMGDFLISGSSTGSSSLVANRRSGSGSVIHNVFYREIN